VENNGSVHAAGGAGGSSPYNYANGGSGGVGRIRVDAEALRVNGIEVNGSTFQQTTTPQVGYLGLP